MRRAPPRGGTGTRPQRRGSLHYPPRVITLAALTGPLPKAGVVVVAVLAVLAVRSDAPQPRTQTSWLERLLALLILLYALQALYSTDFETGLKNTVFFYVPFALLYCLLVRIEWTPRLIRICAWTIAGLALALAGVPSL